MDRSNCPSGGFGGPGGGFGGPGGGFRTGKSSGKPLLLPVLKKPPPGPPNPPPGPPKLPPGPPKLKKHCPFKTETPTIHRPKLLPPKVIPSCFCFLSFPI